MILTAPKTPSNSRRGSALVFALLVVSLVAAFSLGMMQLNGSVTRRQGSATQDKRAFYLAEAGLSEAYYGLQTGNSGQIGSIEAPALIGDGLAWVDASWGDDGFVTLRSTGLCESGRSTLEIVVRRETNPFGVFADEGIDIEVPFMLDGYDSETTTYYEQAGMMKLKLDPDSDYRIEFDKSGDLLLYANDLCYHCVDYDLQELKFYYTQTSKELVTYIDEDEYGREVTSWDGGLLSSAGEFDSIMADSAFESQQGATFDIPVKPYAEFTTGVGGQLGSNGSVSLGTTTGDPIEVFGDVVPGPEGVLSTNTNVSITGSTLPRTEVLELPPVIVPSVEILPGFTHTSLIPKVLPPGDVGYESISVGPDSELVIQGPGNLVVGELVLEGDSTMTVENDAGAVNLYVTEFADLAEGALVEVQSSETSDLALQGSSTATDLQLEAKSQFHGMVYAPDSHVRVGSDFEVFGMIASNTLDVAPYARLHFDSGVLGDSGVVPIPRLVAWSIQEIPRQVRQSRIDPFELLSLNPADLETVAEAQETVSWIYECSYMDAANDYQSYAGPFEQFDAGLVKSFTFPFPKLTEPEADLSAPWTVHAEYKTLFGVSHDFDGTVAEYKAQVLFSAASLQAFSVTAPPELQ